MVLKKLRSFWIGSLTLLLSACQVLEMPRKTPQPPAQNVPSRQVLIPAPAPTTTPTPAPQPARPVSPEPFSTPAVPERLTPAPSEVLPQDAPATTSLPVVRQLLAQTQQLSAQGEFQKAQQKLEQAVRVSPKDPEVFIAWGDLYRAQNDRNAAREMYLRARALSPAGSRPEIVARQKLEQL